MASQITDKHKLSLTTYKNKRVGLKPYENGLWSTQGDRDFVQFELYDKNNNFIQYKNYPSSEFVIDGAQDLEFYPGNHIQGFGFESGTFIVRYNFLRRLAGSDDTVLVRTKNGFKGDIWSDYSQIYISDDGKVYLGTEEDYLLDKTGVEQLAIEDLKYQIDDISPSRTEVRLKAKNIQGNYIDDFLNIQNSIIREEIKIEGGSIIFSGPAQGNQTVPINEVKEIVLSGDNNFQFTPKMVDGTLTIPDVFTIDEIVVPVRSGNNILQNPNGEELELDAGANVVNLANKLGWDASLHDDAVKPIGWSSGFNPFDESQRYKITAGVGYHAKWVQGEGISGGVCMKFPDTNDIFKELGEPIWPTNASAHRWLGISQKMSPLSNDGIVHEDEVNISLDVKSTALGKGVAVSMNYANRLVDEEKPTDPPDGYWNPGDGPTEEKPTSPPANFVPNTIAGANSIESKPPSTRSEILAIFPRNTDGTPHPFDAAIGDTTAAFPFGGIGPHGNYPGVPGAGVWIIADIRTGGETYIWAPNVPSNTDNDSKGTKEGKLSPGETGGSVQLPGQWKWDGVGAWKVNLLEAWPQGITGTVSPYEFQNAVNAFAFTPDGDGTFYARRDTAPGENFGWQTGTEVDSKTNKRFILIKDDLVWRSKYGGDNRNIKLVSIEEYFDNIFRDNSIADPSTGGSLTLYEDIFAMQSQHGKDAGYIQSITRASTGPDDYNEVLEGGYYIFYNDGRGTEDSNKWFKVFKDSGGTYSIEYQSAGQGIKHLKDLSEDLNNAVMASGNKFEVTFERTGATEGFHFEYYFAVGNMVYMIADWTGELGFDANGNTTDVHMDYPKSLADEFSFNKAPDVWFSKNSTENKWSSFDAIMDGTLYTNTDTDGGEQHALEDKKGFKRLGRRGTYGETLKYGNRNPADRNTYDSTAIYDDNSAVPIYPPGLVDPTMEGALSPDELWRWDGGAWYGLAPDPPRYKYVSKISEPLIPTRAGEWQRFDVKIGVPEDCVLDQYWNLYIYGHSVHGGGGFGVTWVDNLFVDYTLFGQSTTQEVKRPFSAQILEVSEEGKRVIVDKSYSDESFKLGVGDANPDTAGWQSTVPDEGGYGEFSVSYLNFNPKDLRTYLKFDNNLFLTTNFKQDRIGVSEWPYSVVYKLYEPLPNEYRKLDECNVVKEMANPFEEKIKIIDFIPDEEPQLVLKSPDMDNLLSPIRRRSTQYKTETDILTSDKTISTELRNEFLSQSLDSVEINTDYSRYKNFVNFSSAEKRIRNFKTKIGNIEDHKINSASYIGVSGSLKDKNLYHFKIEDVKNNFDDFERYMYFESSSYVTSSLGEFHDNAWPKTGGSGTISSPYVLAHTTSSQADTWFTNAINSSSLYDVENLSKLSSTLPEHIKENTDNNTYVHFIDMIGQHFDLIWEYTNALTDTFDRRDKLDEGISKDLLWNIAKSLGWTLSDGKDLISLPRYALGKEVTGSVYSDYSATSERDISREIWSRIINNMPFFLKNKGTVKALKGLINIYGIPSTILRVKEYGGPDVPDDNTPQYEITRKFTKALDFRGSQYVKVAWANDTVSGRKPDTVEFRFRAATGSNQILVEKKDVINQDWFIRLKDNGSTDNYGTVSFMLSGSRVGIDQGAYKEISSSALPVYDGDFYSVMVRRMIGSDDTSVSQSYELNVGKYDSSRSKIHLYSTSTMDVTQAASSSFSNAWTGSGDVYIGGSATVADVGVQFSGSIMEYRHWTEVLNTGSFKNHVGNPKAYDGNTVSSSYENLVLRYSMDDNKDLSSDTDGIRDVSSNQTSTLSGSHSGFTGNFFRSVVDEQKTHIPSIGALRRSTDKIRIESNPLKGGFLLSSTQRATVSAYDTSPLDSNKVGIWFAPTDVINNDIINSVADLNFDNYLGDPRDKIELSYRGLNYVADNYWKKYTSPNNFWDYMRLMKFYDQSMYPQLRKLIPARAKVDIGLMIEPNIFERPKIPIGKTVDVENRFYSSSIDISKAVDGLIVITGSYNNDGIDTSISEYGAYTGLVNVNSYKTGSTYVSASGEQLLKEASGSEVHNRSIDLSLWQRLNTSNDEYYTDVTMSFGDTVSGSKEVIQPFISGSRIYGRNQKVINFFTSSIDALRLNYTSQSFKNSDIDVLAGYNTSLFNRYYAGVKNNINTTSDGNPPVEVVITAPTQLVTVESGDTTLETGQGIVPDFKEPVRVVKEKEIEKAITKQPKTDKQRADEAKLPRVIKLHIKDMKDSGDFTLDEVDEYVEEQVDINNKNKGNK